MTAQLEDRVRTAMRVVVEGADMPPVPRPPASRDPQPKPRRRLRRRVSAVLAVSGACVIGVGAAAASGVFPHGAKAAFKGWEDINPADAIVIGPLRGPAGTTITAYEAPDHANGQTCIALTLKGDPIWTHGLGGSCADQDSGGIAGGFAQSGGSIDNDRLSVGRKPTIAVFTFAAGDAPRAVVEYGGGMHPAVVQHGLILGWMPERYWGQASLLGLDAAGNVIAVVHDVGANNGSTITAGSGAHPAPRR